MKRIAILGCENSHANAFLKVIHARRMDVEVVGVYSDDPTASQKLNKRFGVPILADYADAVGRIDGLVVTARHGDNHYKYAKPYIESGIPMFIDKPITISEAEALEMMQAFCTHGVRFSGGSSLKQADEIVALRQAAMAQEGGRTLGGFIRAPYHRFNAYGNLYFYAQHLVEMMGEIFGRYPLTVTAREQGDQLHVLFHYEEYDTVGLFLDHTNCYFAARMVEKETQSYSVAVTDDWFEREFLEIYSLLEGKESPTSPADFIAPVFVMNAIERSLSKGGVEEPVHRFTL